LPRYVYKARKELVEAAITQGIMPFLDYWFAVGELLILMNRNPSSGSVNDLKRFKTLLEAIWVWSNNQCNLEDILTKRYCVGRSAMDFISLGIKYAVAYRKSQKSMGLLSYQDIVTVTESFTYFHLEDDAISEVDLNTTIDLSDWFDSLWQISLQQRYAFRIHYRMYKQYDYKLYFVDLSVLGGWFIKIPTTNETCMQPIENLLDSLRSHFEKFGGGFRISEQFLKEYVDSSELVPIVVCTPDCLFLDRFILVYFLIFLYGCQNQTNDREGNLPKPIVDTIRGDKLGNRFEDWLRKEVYGRGYTGSGSVVEIRSGGQQFEYDILAISEDKRRIILADAKFRDMVFFVVYRGQSHQTRITWSQCASFRS